MAPRYPTYQRTGRLSAGIAVPPSADFAALREQGKSATLVSQAADRVVAFATDKIEQQSIARGQRDAAQNPRGVLQQYQDGAPQTAYDKAAYEAAVKISSANIEVKARKDIADALFQWEQEKGDPTALRDRLSAISQGYSSAIGELDPIEAAKLNLTLESAGNSAFLQYSETHLKEQLKRLQAGGIAAHNSYGEQIEIGARNGIDPEPTIAAYRATAQNLGVDPSTVERNVINLRDRASKERVRGDFARATDKAQFLRDFMEDADDRTGPARGVDGDTHKTLAAEMRAIIKGEGSAAASRKAAVNRQTTELTSALTGGSDVSEAAVQDNLAQARATGDETAIANAARLEQLHQRLGIANGQNVFGLEQLVYDANDLRGKDPNAANAQLNNDLVAAFESRLTAMRTALATDQVSYLRENGQGVGEVGPSDVAQSAAGDAMLVDPSSPLLERKRSIDDFAASNNAKPIYFSQSEARAYTQFMQDANVPNSEKTAFVMGLANAFGDQTANVINQIDSGNGSDWAFAAANFSRTGNQNFLADALEGRNYDGPTIKPEADKDTRDKISAGIAGQILSGSKRAQALKAAEHAYKHRLGTGVTEDSRGSLWERTLQEAMGATFQGNRQVSGGVYEFGNSQIILDPRTPVSDAEFVEDNRRYMTREAMSALVGFEITPDEMSDDDITNFQLRSTGVANSVEILNARGQAPRGNPRIVTFTNLHTALRRSLESTKEVLTEVGPMRLPQ
jgi:hypothetical protein